jgi:hydroxyethylthiazole kinase-like uncharacterized protein yjeF
MTETDPITPPPPPVRPPDAHKGTFGTVVVVGGSPTMIGAPALTAHAALRTGAGLVKIAADVEILPFCLEIEPSATGILLQELPDPQTLNAFVEGFNEKTVFAVGPGMGVGPQQQAWVQALTETDYRGVLDADGLNNLATLPTPLEASGWVLTPHPGEYKRLADGPDIDADPTNPQERVDAAGQLARYHHAVVVLKGQHSVVHDGRRAYVNQTGNPALATAGSGDVLTGVIASLMAQGLESFDAAVLGVHLHGLAADLWAQDHGQAGLTARDLATRVPDAIESHRRATS